MIWIDFMIKAFFWILVILCFVSFVYGLGSFAKRKSDGEDIKSDTVTSFVFAGLTFAVSLVLFFGGDEIKKESGDNISTTTPIETVSASVSDSTESHSIPITTNPSTVDNTEQPIEPNQGNSIVNVNNNGIIYQSSSNNNGIIYQSNSDGELIIQGNKWTCTANKEHAVFSNKFPAKKNHTHRLDFKNSNVNNKYQVTIYDSSGKEVPTYNVSENGLTVEFIAKETYEIRIEVVQYDCPSEFIIEIKEPDN